MGNAASGDYQKHLSRLSPEEQAEADRRFESICQRTDSSKKRLGLSAFQDSMGSTLPSTMSQRIFWGIQSIKTPSAGPDVSREQFILFLVDLFRGTAEEKGGVIIRMVGQDDCHEVTGRQLQQFVEDLIRGVVYVLRQNNALNGWSLENTRDCDSGTCVLATQLISQIKPEDGEPGDFASFGRARLEDWLYKVPMVSAFLRVLVALGLSVMKENPEQQMEVRGLLPRCRTGREPSFRSLLDIPAVLFLNSLLPAHMRHKWRLLFTTALHGQSFSQMCGRLVDQGPSLLVVRDRDGFIFGGFASQNWEVKPQFQGDNRCFLFTISPQLDVYTHTGYNDHYMYLNHGQQTMPNGLGMGGQHDYFGLWIDSNFGKGHSKAKPRCTTYNSPQLSGKDEFLIDALEAWALGDLPEHVQAKTKKSILDADPEAKALLEMTGRTRQSDGLRTKDDEDDDR